MFYTVVVISFWKSHTLVIISFWRRFVLNKSTSIDSQICILVSQILQMKRKLFFVNCDDSSLLTKAYNQQSSNEMPNWKR